MKAKMAEPPVTVLMIPEKYGSRGYGAKKERGKLLIPYNESVVRAFNDVLEKRTATILRKRYFELESV
jgi:hypothetical protein